MLLRFRFQIQAMLRRSPSTPKLIAAFSGWLQTIAILLRFCAHRGVVGNSYAGTGRIREMVFLNRPCVLYPVLFLFGVCSGLAEPSIVKRNGRGIAAPLGRYFWPSSGLSILLLACTKAHDHLGADQSGARVGARAGAQAVVSILDLVSSIRRGPGSRAGFGLAAVCLRQIRR
jgi:hypothetical protein